jgi:hypothetical protein
MINEASLARIKKDKILQAFHAREALNDILMIPPHLRTKEDESKLVDLLLDFPCFQCVAARGLQRLRELSRDVEMECILQDSELIRQGDEARDAYVMVQG